jgi:hypothetical protein
MALVLPPLVHFQAAVRATQREKPTKGVASLKECMSL